jgi:hypothetical protein
MTKFQCNHFLQLTNGGGTTEEKRSRKLTEMLGFEV